MGWRPFPYVRLSSTQIRYITVHHSNGAAGKVRCTLHQAPLENVDFDALSYVWGDASVTETIILSGKPFRATTNLVACLRQLSTRPDETILWVDAICINQTDVDERNAQVQRMKNIYSAARSVIAWIGSSTRLSRIGVEHLQNIDIVETVNLQNSKEERHIKQRADILKMVLTHDGEPGLRDLLLRPYWYRTWVIQEISLGQMPQTGRMSPRVSFLCGEDEIPFYKLWALTVLLVDQSSILDGPTMATAEPSVINWSMLFSRFFYDVEAGALRLILTIEKPIRPLQELLSLFRSFQCLDDRDKIYALLGISSDAEGISPNYHKSIATVYSDVAYGFIKKDDSLDILSTARYHSERDLSHASWIPNWRHGSPFAHGYADKIYHKGNYNCSKGLLVSSHSWSLNRATGGLHLAGACLDTITSLSKDFPSGTGELEEILSSVWVWLSMIHERFGKGHLKTTLLLGLDGGRYPLNDDEPLAEACRRTLVADCDSFGAGPVRSPHMMVLPWDKSQKRSDGSTHIDGATDEAYLTLLLCRRLAITSKGWIGLVHREAEIGDHIAVLIGASVPFILRKVQVDGTRSRHNEYTLIGDAYIHGLMHGKGLDLAEMGEIVLR